MSNLSISYFQAATGIATCGALAVGYAARFRISDAIGSIARLFASDSTTTDAKPLFEHQKIARKIFSELSPEDQKAAKLVCTQWYLTIKEISDEKKLSFLEKKIESKMRKIVSANKQIREMNTFMSDESPGIPFRLLEYTKRCLEKNLKKLASYNQTFVKCRNADNMYLDIDIDLSNVITSSSTLSIGLSTAQVRHGVKPGFIQKRAQRLFNRAMSSSHIKFLYIEAMLSPHPDTKEIGSWLLFFMKDDLTKKVEAGCDHQYRTIYLASTLSDDEALTSFVFELTNAANGEKFHELEKLASEGKLGRDEYAYQVEALEHEGCLKHHLIMKDAIKEMGWDASLDIYQDAGDFEMAWILEVQNSEHAEFYREHWDLLQKEAIL